MADIRFLNANDYREQFSAGNSVGLNCSEGIGGNRRLTKVYSRAPWQNVMLTVIDNPVGEHLYEHGVYVKVLRVGRLDGVSELRRPL